jgi:hypothetical protein
MAGEEAPWGSAWVYWARSSRSWPWWSERSARLWILESRVCVDIIRHADKQQTIRVIAVSTLVRRETATAAASPRERVA